MVYDDDLLTFAISFNLNTMVSMHLFLCFKDDFVFYLNPFLCGPYGRLDPSDRPNSIHRNLTAKLLLVDPVFDRCRTNFRPTTVLSKPSFDYSYV